MVYRVVNPNAVLMLVRRVTRLPAFMVGDTLVVLYRRGHNLPSLERLNEEFRRVLGVGLFDVVDGVEIKVV